MKTNRMGLSVCVWCGPLFVRRRIDYGLAEKNGNGVMRLNRPRKLLVKLGDRFLGDRWEGTLKVQGDKVIVGPDKSGRSGDDEGETLTLEVVPPEK